MPTIHCRPPPSSSSCCCCWHVGSQQLRFPTSLPAFLANTCAQAASIAGRAIQGCPECIPPQGARACLPSIAEGGRGRCRGQRNIPATQLSTQLATQLSSTPVCKLGSRIRGSVQLEIFEVAGETSKWRNNRALICTVSISCGVDTNSDRCVGCSANDYDTGGGERIPACCRCY